MKKVLKNVLLFIITILPFMALVTVKADSGWDSSYDSSSSSSSSWSSSSSSSSSWSSSSSSSSSSYGDDDELTFVDSIIILIIIFLFIVLPTIIITRKGNNNKSNYVDSSYTDIPEDKLKEILPNLTLKYLKDVTYERFVAIQNAWMNFDYDKLRELCTDELYNSYISQLDTLKLKNGQNIMSDFKLQQINIINIKEEDGKVAITVYMRVRFKDYVINQKTKEVIRGNSSSYIVNNYVMTFVRGKDAINKDISCPNCGAPISNTASSKCEYCGSDIVKDSSEFVLSKKTNVNK